MAYTRYPAVAAPIDSAANAAYAQASELAALRALAQRFLDVGDQVFDVFDADREAHEAVGEADLLRASGFSTEA